MIKKTNGKCISMFGSHPILNHLINSWIKPLKSSWNSRILNTSSKHFRSSIKYFVNILSVKTNLVLGNILGNIFGNTSMYRVTGEISYPFQNRHLIKIMFWLSQKISRRFRISKRFWSCDVVHEKVCTKRVRHYSVRTRNQITSFAMTGNSKNSEIIQSHHQLSSKLIFLYPRHNWSDLLFLFILIVFYYYVLLDVYPPRNFKIF